MFSNAVRLKSYSLVAQLPELKDVLNVFPVLERHGGCMGLFVGHNKDVSCKVRGPGKNI